MKDIFEWVMPKLQNYITSKENSDRHPPPPPFHSALRAARSLALIEIMTKSGHKAQAVEHF
jgi:hypothetical protein